MEEGEVEEVVSGVEVEVDERKVEVAWLVGTSTFGVEVEGGKCPKWKWKFEGVPWVEKWKCARRVEGVSLVGNCPKWGS